MDATFVYNAKVAFACQVETASGVAAASEMDFLSETFPVQGMRLNGFG